MQDKQQARKARFNIYNIQSRVHDLLSVVTVTKRIVARDPSIPLEYAAQQLREQSNRKNRRIKCKHATKFPF
ncbi:hypothetical protein F441_20868 [Phytophthora nicotianae CJ01A1]|uniref:Uncharacterized protein n=5 Tax=Phytophthora nicotianae TaxID=4792 RepID=W2PGX0_PHYN3|nr:hypothetical protein PPTG_24319 [Phytophthora nicotianae INRA-310]ETI32116.1 hypothetical protein F443_21001 [Phytophthora nicotianae P1569]ETK72501.1 hypothetical protein L915_20403 [Phytophthora nicotianae]ETP01969.1 hypothetical protein F441_20868 [Phytophthora nicotianae CJ01A1]ETP30126.1 hypothetical protein F442_20809 [Phytophthora nicotianae P10297]ETL25959.1 hypothetical protein L916_20263 [Phytophthora nicotianae]